MLIFTVQIQPALKFCIWAIWLLSCQGLSHDGKCHRIRVWTTPGCLIHACAVSSVAQDPHGRQALSTRKQAFLSVHSYISEVCKLSSNLIGNHPLSSLLQWFWSCFIILVHITFLALSNCKLKFFISVWKSSVNLYRFWMPSLILAESTAMVG